MENIANFEALAIRHLHNAPSIFTPKTPRKRAKFAHLDSHLKQAVDVQVFPKSGHTKFISRHRPLDTRRSGDRPPGV